MGTLDGGGCFQHAYECFACTCVSVPPICLVPMQVSKGCWMSQNCGYGPLWTTMCLSLNLSPLQEQVFPLPSHLSSPCSGHYQELQVLPWGKHLSFSLAICFGWSRLSCNSRIVRSAWTMVFPKWACDHVQDIHPGSKRFGDVWAEGVSFPTVGVPQGTLFRWTVLITIRGLTWKTATSFLLRVASGVGRNTLYKQ